jgi:hypothetical protein
MNPDIHFWIAHELVKAGEALIILLVTLLFVGGIWLYVWISDKLYRRKLEKNTERAVSKLRGNGRR